MRILIWLLVLGAAGWSGYWYVASSGLGRGLDGWLEARSAEGHPVTDPTKHWPIRNTLHHTGRITTEMER